MTLPLTVSLLTVAEPHTSDLLTDQDQSINPKSGTAADQ